MPPPLKCRHLVKTVGGDDDVCTFPCWEADDDGGDDDGHANVKTVGDNDDVYTLLGRLMTLLVMMMCTLCTLTAGGDDDDDGDDDVCLLLVLGPTDHSGDPHLVDELMWENDHPDANAQDVQIIMKIIMIVGL